jgi:hypothetical protein
MIAIAALFLPGSGLCLDRNYKSDVLHSFRVWYLASRKGIEYMLTAVMVILIGTHHSHNSDQVIGRAAAE